MIIITSKKDGFRRCGIAHSSTPVTYEEGAFTAEQMAALTSEQNLVVEIVPNEQPPEPKKTKKAEVSE